MIKLGARHRRDGLQIGVSLYDVVIGLEKGTQTPECSNGGFPGAIVRLVITEIGQESSDIVNEGRSHSMC